MSKAVKRFDKGGTTIDGGFDFTDGYEGDQSYLDYLDNAGVDADPDYTYDWLNSSTGDGGSAGEGADVTTIGDITYTKGEDGKWYDDEGWSYSDDEITQAKDNPEFTQDPGDALVNVTPGGATTPGDRTNRNPTTGGTGGVSAPSGIDRLTDMFKKPGGGWDLGKLAAAGLTAAGLTDIIANLGKGAGPDNAYKGAIDMDMKYERNLNPQDMTRRPGSASKPFFGESRGWTGESFTPSYEAPSAGGIAALPGTATGGGIDVIQGGMPKDARVLPDGAVIGRNDPRFFDGVATGGGIDGIQGGGAELAAPSYSVDDMTPAQRRAYTNYSREKMRAWKAANNDGSNVMISGGGASGYGAAPSREAMGIASEADWMKQTNQTAGSAEWDAHRKFLADTNQWDATVKAAQEKAAASRIANGWGPQTSGANLVLGPTAATQNAPAAGAPKFVGSFVNAQGETVDYDANGKHYARAPAATTPGAATPAPAVTNTAMPAMVGSFQNAQGETVDYDASGKHYARAQKMAGGGIAGLNYAKGGPTKPRYLRGETDGMADKVKARIDGGQEARLAHGEFVIPADVVSHLGNGNSDAGAKKLYSMMDKIRTARTGNKKQGKEINPDKFMPGMKGMATGGITDVVPRFATGGTTLGVNNWAGPYATSVLSQGNAVGNDMMQNSGNYVYQGERSADASPLQKQTFASAGAQLTQPYTGTQFGTQDFTGANVQKYMNPYLQQSLEPQIAEARRQADITRMTNAGRLVGSGAFGGGRQAVMEAEGDRNLSANLANITGQGYNKAYDNATQQFNTQQGRELEVQKAGEQSKQFGKGYGINALTTAANLGSQQRGIYQQGLDAEMGRFNEEAALPTQAIKFKQSLLQGMPISNTTSTTADPSTMQQLMGLGLTAAQIASLFGEG